MTRVLALLLAVSFLIGSGTWYSALADQAGSPHSVVSEAGVQGTISRWDPFGAPRPGSTIGSGIGYAGEWRDPAALIDLRARAYDPAAGRFTGRDGFGGLAQAPQSANRYSYAQNGPYRYADPSGRFVNAVYAQRRGLTRTLSFQERRVYGAAGRATSNLPCLPGGCLNMSTPAYPVDSEVIGR